MAWMFKFDRQFQEDKWKLAGKGNREKGRNPRITKIFWKVFLIIALSPPPPTGTKNWRHEESGQAPQIMPPQDQSFLKPAPPHNLTTSVDSLTIIRIIQKFYSKINIPEFYIQYWNVVQEYDFHYHRLHR